MKQLRADLVGVEPTASGLEVPRPIQARLQALIINLCYYYYGLYFLIIILYGI